MKGFTLIEFLAYIAVLAILGGSVSGLFLWTLNAHTKAKALEETVSGTQTALLRVLREIQEAEALYLSTTTTTQLSLLTQTAVPQGETEGYVDFFLCGDRLCMKKEELAPFALTPASLLVSELSFATISTDTEFPAVQITLKTEHRNPNNRPELQAAAEFSAAASVR